MFGISFSPDGKKLATASADKFVKVFETSTGKLSRSFEGHTHHVMDVGWKQDGKVVVSVGADDLIKVWDLEKGEQIRSFGNQKKQLTNWRLRASHPRSWSPAAITMCGPGISTAARPE